MRARAMVISMSNNNLMYSGLDNRALHLLCSFADFTMVSLWGYLYLLIVFANFICRRNPFIFPSPGPGMP